MPPRTVMRCSISMYTTALAALSQYAARPVWVQGPGGNTSVKNDNGRMYVKASGVLLSGVNEQAGWVETDLIHIKKQLTQEGLSGREQHDTALIDEAVRTSAVSGAQPGLRPSMETAFHSLYQRYVLHTHNAFANIYLCSDRAEDICTCLPGEDDCFSSLVNDYYTPGAELSWMLYDLYRFEPEMPQITLLPNHGIICAAHSLEELYSVHDNFHARVSAQLGLNQNDYPVYALHPGENSFRLQCGFLENYFSASDELPAIFTEYLVPDHAVYLYPEYYSRNNSKAKVFFDAAAKTITLNTTEKEAITLAELMINSAFLWQQITTRNFEPLTINFDTEKLRNMGAEQYRRKQVEG